MIKSYFAGYKAFPFTSTDEVKKEIDFIGFKCTSTIVRIKDESFQEGWNNGRHIFLYITKQSNKSILRDKEGVVCSFRTQEKLDNFLLEHLTILEEYKITN